MLYDILEVLFRFNISFFFFFFCMLQCFDFYNFIDINSRRPSWRCPHCNQYICFLDICIDRNMLKASLVIDLF